jgi:hypothetical protein
VSAYTSCSGSVLGQHDADSKGTCRWCGKRNVDTPIPRPERFGRDGHDDSELGAAYRYFYDPDYESHNDYD